MDLWQVVSTNHFIRRQELVVKWSYQIPINTWSCASSSSFLAGGAGINIRGINDGHRPKNERCGSVNPPLPTRLLLGKKIYKIWYFNYYNIFFWGWLYYLKKMVFSGGARVNGRPIRTKLCRTMGLEVQCWKLATKALLDGPASTLVNYLWPRHPINSGYFRYLAVFKTPAVLCCKSAIFAIWMFSKGLLFLFMTENPLL